MNTPKNHHYLPQCYLKNFQCNDREEFVWIYRTNRKSVQQHIENVGAENFFYPINVEKDLNQKVDDKYAKLLKILNSPISVVQIKPSILMSYEDFDMLSHCVAYQKERTPVAKREKIALYAHRERIKLQLKAKNKERFHRELEIFSDTKRLNLTESKIEDLRKRILKGKYKFEAEKDHSYYLGMCMMMSLRDYPIIRERELIVLKASEDTCFITSDSPIILAKSNLYPHRTGDYGIDFYDLIFPIGSKTALFFRIKKMIDQNISQPQLLHIPVKKVSTDFVNNVNQHIIDYSEDFVVSSLNDSEIEAEMQNRTRTERLEFRDLDD